MPVKKAWIALMVLATALNACASAKPSGVPTEAGQGAGPGAFSATAASSVRVDLTWAPASWATGYVLEARYGSGDFFEGAKLPGNETSYSHFVVPNSKVISYRLTALTAAGSQQVGSAMVSLPELSPNPVVVTELQPFLPAALGGEVDLSTMPTLDPSNPDPKVMATIAAMAEGMANENPEDLLAGLEPISMTQMIGPEGGTMEVKDPNGVTYQLEVPAGLVETETEFRLDPYEKLGGLPFGRLFAAVLIFPPIEFSVPLHLTVTLPEAPDSEKVVAFDLSHFDGELSLAPVHRDGNVFSMNVYWGDVVGIAGGGVDEILTQGSKTPTDAAAQISQQIAVLQALTEDPSPEAFAGLLNQVFEGLFQPSEVTGYQPGPGGGRLAAPSRQEGTSPDIHLWNEIARVRRAWSDGTMTPGEIPAFDPMAVELSDHALRAAWLVDLVGQIKTFLETHSGCRTHDAFYAQALQQLLRSPQGDFEERLAETYTATFGPLKESKHSTFRFHVVSSRIVVDSASASTTLRVHVNPFTMTVTSYADRVILFGGGNIAYDEMTEVIKTCGPTPTKLTPPPSAFFWIAELRPMFDERSRIVDFYQVKIEATGSGSAGKQAKAQTGDKCGTLARITTPSPDLWGGAYVAYRQLHPRSGAWKINGEDSYVATYDESFTESGSSSSVSVDISMVLTANEEGP